jgi:hypothetical protein
MNDAEQKAYKRGYAAGRRYAKMTRNAMRRDAQQRALWVRLFVALLPKAMASDGWTIGTIKVTTGEQRVELAERWADRAYQVARGKL